MKDPLVFCTVITRDRLRQASALYESLKASQPAFDFYALVIDAPGEAGRPAAFKTIYPKALRLKNFESMKRRYSAFELCNALRPSFVKYLMLSRKAGKVVYLDSDIFAAGSFEKVNRALSKKKFCFTPHILTPYPADGKFPDDFTVLGYGIYNSGFFAFKNHKVSHEILDFMAKRFERYCFDDPPFLFVDQKWFPLVAHLYREHFYLLDDPGYNVAYWNLHERKITRKGGRYFVNGKKAVFFHMSGFNEKKPALFTTRGTRPDRAKPASVARSGPRFTERNYPVLKTIIKDYLRILV